MSTLRLAVLLLLGAACCVPLSKVQAEDVSSELQTLKESVERAKNRVEGLKTNMIPQLIYIVQEVKKAADITKNTNAAVEAVKNELQEEEQETIPTCVALSPCLDSTFSGTVNVTCQLALKNDICSVPEVSYHCCRTCTDAGMLPETGSWRQQNLPRTVTTQDVMRFFLK